MKVDCKYGSAKVMQDPVSVQMTKHKSKFVCNLSLYSDSCELSEDDVPCEGLSPCTPIKLPLYSDQACKNKLIQDKGRIKERDRDNFTKELRSMSSNSNSPLSSLDLVQSDENNILVYNDSCSCQSSEKIEMKPNSVYNPHDSFTVCYQSEIKQIWRVQELSKSVNNKDDTPQPFRLRKDKLNEMDSSLILSQLYDQKHQENCSKRMKIYKIVKL